MASPTRRGSGAAPAPPAAPEGITPGRAGTVQDATARMRARDQARGFDLSGELRDLPAAPAAGAPGTFTDWAVPGSVPPKEGGS